MTLPFSIWPRLGLRNYKNLKIQGTTKVTRKTSYKEDCILDLVLSPLYCLVLVINYITFNTQITFDILCMLSKIWCVSLKQHMQKKMQVCACFPYISQ